MGKQKVLNGMVASILWIESAVNFFMNVILIITPVPT
jgi:hypothetical protein